jgi:hypothetical protein
MRATGSLVRQVLRQTLGITDWSRKVQKLDTRTKKKNANHSRNASPTRGYSLLVLREEERTVVIQTE